MNQIIEKISWIPFKFINSIAKKPKNPLMINLKKIGVPKKINFYFIEKDEGLSKQFSLFKFREPLNWKNYYYFVDKDDVVLDVGANIGLFSILSCNSKKIISVEPIKECISILKKNLHLNELNKKAVILNMAVGKKGKLYMKQDAHINLSKVVDKKDKFAQEVKSQTLSYFVKKYSPNLLRMDVEGYESEILKGKIPKNINKISMEFHTGLMGKEKSIKLLKNLEKEGFKIKKIVEDLPLRLYPFYSLIKKINFLDKFTYEQENISYTECISLVFKGRSLKYLFLKRN